jgi:hypothetical protein
MQRLGIAFACFVAIVITGCSPLDSRYTREGIGVGLFSSGLPEASNLQELYIGYICQQAGLPVVADGGQVFCATGFGPTEWSLFVQAGMNDIDRRCDAYLAWLDDKRRLREPVLNQLAAMGAATAAILAVTGVGATPIAIVGVAFGLAADTFTNVSSRLLLEIDHSTVQSVVLGNQTEFRAQNLSVIVDNRPAAIYLLRNYLRLCVPFSIEMSINNTVTIYHRDPEALRTTPLLLRTPVASRLYTARAIIQSIPPAGARGPLPGVAGAPVGPTARGPGSTTPREQTKGSDVAIGSKNPTEKGIPMADFMDIQRNLCVKPTGEFDTATRNAILQAKRGDPQSNPNATQFGNTENQIASAAETLIFLKARPCRLDKIGADRGYQTAFEKFAFPEEAAITSLQILLAKCYPTLEGQRSGKFDALTRAAIKAAKGKLSPGRRSGLTDLDTDTLNDGSYNAISLTCK